MTGTTQIHSESGYMTTPRRLQDIVGDCGCSRCFDAALRMGRLAHAYLLIGQDEDTKLLLARSLAKIGNCHGEHGPGEFCDACSSCRQLDAGGSPNLRVFGDPLTVNVAAVDDFIKYVAIKTPAGSLKVSVFRGVDFFTDVAADRILKTLEEPAPGNLILLLSRNSRRVLPTIRSRTQIVKVERPVATEASAAPVDTALEGELEVILDFARGNVGLSETAIRLSKLDIHATARDNALESVRVMGVFMNSILRARSKVSPTPEISPVVEPELARVNFVLDEQRVTPFLVHLGDHARHLEQNTNPELVLTNVLLELRRITTHE